MIAEVLVTSREAQAKRLLCTSMSTEIDDTITKLDRGGSMQDFEGIGSPCDF